MFPHPTLTNYYQYHRLIERKYEQFLDTKTYSPNDHETPKWPNHYYRLTEWKYEQQFCWKLYKLHYSGAYAWCGFLACSLDRSAYGLATSVFTQLWAWPSNLCIEPLQKLLYQIWAKVKKNMQIYAN